MSLLSIYALYLSRMEKKTCSGFVTRCSDVLLQVPKEYRAIYEEKCRKLTEQFRDVGLCDSREELNGEQNTPL